MECTTQLLDNIEKISESTEIVAALLFFWGIAKLIKYLSD